jgi:hypothetical protein
MASLAFCVNANAPVMLSFTAVIFEIIASVSADEVTLPYFNGSSMLEYPRTKCGISTTSIRVEVKVSKVYSTVTQWYSILVQADVQLWCFAVQRTGDSEIRGLYCPLAQRRLCTL